MLSKTNFNRQWAAIMSGMTTGILLLGLLLNGTLNLTPPAYAAGTPTVTVTWGDIHQTIEGFGASGAYQRATWLMNFPEPQRTQILDALFSQTTGAGLSIVRSEIGDGWHWVGPLGLDEGVPTIEPTEGTWSWTGDEGQIWLMQQAKSRGATRFFATPWSPPAWMKTNGQVANGGSLLTTKYQAYATFLSTYVRNYQTQFGINYYAISLANEPTSAPWWPSCVWTGAQFRDFIRDYLKPTFQADGVTAKVIIPEDAAWSETLASETLADANAAARLDIVAAHHYSGNIGLFTNARSHNKSVWETEVSNMNADDVTITDGLTWAKEVHNFMVTAEANAFNYWWLVDYKSTGEGLIKFSPPSSTYTLTKRLFTIGNFARFVRPGYIHIGATASPANNLYTSAYRDPVTNQFVIVAINDNTGSKAINISPSGFSATTVTPYLTDATHNLAQQSNVSLSGGVFAVTLPAKSVTTYVGYSTAPTPGATYTPLPTLTPAPTSTATFTPMPTATPGPTATNDAGFTSFATGVTTGTDIRNDYGSYVGMKITVGGSAISVKKLGRRYLGSNTGTHTLEIVRASDGVVLGSATVDMATSAADSLGFKYATLASPVTLAANTSYYIASLEVWGGDQWYGRATLPSLTTTGVATVNAGIYYDAINWTTVGGTGNSYVPLNFKY